MVTECIKKETVKEWVGFLVLLNLGRVSETFFIFVAMYVYVYWKYFVEHIYVVILLIFLSKLLKKVISRPV